jgi:hypothetical protein
MIARRHNPYQPVNAPAIGDLINLFDFYSRFMQVVKWKSGPGRFASIDKARQFAKENIARSKV